MCDGSGCDGLGDFGTIFDPAYVPVTAPDGVSQVGCNAEGDLVDTLAGATISSCTGGTGTILVTDPTAGLYKIQIFSVGSSSSYGITLSSFAIDGDQISSSGLSGTVASGSPLTEYLTVGPGGSLTISSNTTTPSQTLNPFDMGAVRSTTFVVFDLQNESGAAVGGAVVTLTAANGLGLQTQTTSSTASTSPLCTESPSWTAEYGTYWGCSAGETGQFILIVGVTYTVTLPSGTVLTGSFVASSPWDATTLTLTS